MISPIKPLDMLIDESIGRDLDFDRESRYEEENPAIPVQLDLITESDDD